MNDLRLHGDLMLTAAPFLLPLIRLGPHAFLDLRRGLRGVLGGLLRVGLFARLLDGEELFQLVVVDLVRLVGLALGLAIRNRFPPFYNPSSWL